MGRAILLGHLCRDAGRRAEIGSDDTDGAGLDDALGLKARDIVLALRVPCHEAELRASKRFDATGLVDFVHCGHAASRGDLAVQGYKPGYRMQVGDDYLGRLRSRVAKHDWADERGPCTRQY